MIRLTGTVFTSNYNSLLYNAPSRLILTVILVEKTKNEIYQMFNAHHIILCTENEIIILKKCIPESVCVLFSYNINDIVEPLEILF